MGKRLCNVTFDKKSGSNPWCYWVFTVTNYFCMFVTVTTEKEISEMIKPEYYQSENIDVIEFSRLMLGNETAKAFCRVNVLKYVIRYDKKNGIEDLHKALTYISRLMELEEIENELKNKI